MYKLFESSDIISQIKKHLTEYYDGYEDFIDHQSMGDCQSIVADIIRNFPEVRKVFGEIEIDDYYRDEYGDEQNLMTHHWVEIDGEYYDFSKGTLKSYIQWCDEYDPCVGSDDWRYRKIN